MKGWPCVAGPRWCSRAARWWWRRASSSRSLDAASSSAAVHPRGSPDLARLRTRPSRTPRLRERSGLRRGAKRSGTGETDQIEDLHGSAEPLEGDVADVLDLDERLHGGGDPLREEDLARLRFRAQARGEVGHGADGAVVEPSFEADGPEGGVAVGDPDAEVELEARLLPGHRQLGDPIAHGRRHAHGARGVVLHRHGIVEEDHHAVARETLEG